MPARKNKTRIRSVDLLQMLDLEERKVLAAELSVDPPENLKDKSFEDSLSVVSLTTMLGKIVDLRRPFLLMLREIYEFFNEMETRGRTTTRAVLLPGARQNLRLLFDSHMAEVTATSLNRKGLLDSAKALAVRIDTYAKAFSSQVNNIRSSSVSAESRVSQSMRRSSDLAERTLARRFLETRKVYDPQDMQDVKSLDGELREINALIDRLVNAPGKLDASGLQVIKKSMDGFRHALANVAAKVRQMESHRPSHGDMGSPRRTIDTDEWEKLLEEGRVLKEEFLAACNFQESAHAIADFLTLDVWRERWRIYELWSLARLIKLLVRLGFTPDISARIKDGVWDLKFTKDQKPIAVLENGKGRLEVYYQLYEKKADGGDMPDIAVKRDGQFLLVLDPKDGRSYGEKGLRDLAARYRDAFSANLTVIHNYYPMSYAYEEVSGSPRALVVSAISPGTRTLTKLDDEIIDLVPQEWLPDKGHFIFLIDVSSSTQLVLDRIVGAAGRALDERSLRAAQQSSLILYTDRIVSETALCDAAELKGVLEASHGGGTDLDAVTGEVLDKFVGVHLPKNLLLFTDEATIQNSVVIGERVRSLGLSLQIFQAVGSGNDETLRELAEACGGRYHRI